MTKQQDTFKRIEKKYLISQEQYKKLKIRLHEHMALDDYGVHKICNIYFDTENYELIRTSIEKPLYKEKLRVRSYGVPRQGDMVFLELKKKFDGVVYKRRVKLTLEEAMDFLLLGKQPKGENQVVEEIKWFLKCYKPEPKAYISYDRCAYFGKEDPELRITFDQSITYRNSSLDLTKGSWGTQIMDSDKILMEIKIPEAMPLWLSQMLASLKIYPASYSKYGTCYKEHVLSEGYLKGSEHCAS